MTWCGKFIFKKRKEGKFITDILEKRGIDKAIILAGIRNHKIEIDKHAFVIKWVSKENWCFLDAACKEAKYSKPINNQK